MKDIAGICLFFFSLYMILHYNSGYVLFTITIIYFSISYYRMKNQIQTNRKYNKKYFDKQKEFFIETMTHDFKVPTLAQLRGLELLKNETIGQVNQEQKELIIQMEVSCKYLLEMIGMFSKAYMFEKNEYKLRYESFNFSDLITSTFESFSAKAQEKNITFGFSSTDKNMIIKADKQELQNVLFLLLDNAINFSNKNGRIDIKMSKNKNKIQISLSGMSLLKQYKNNATMHKYTTIGQTLGMYISKKIIELHNGKFSISQSLKGTLSFEIPTTPENSALCL